MKRAWTVMRLFFTATAITSILTFAATAQTESILYSFTLSDGHGDQNGLTPDAKGNYFGVDSYGGSGAYGVVFELSPNSTGGWTESLIHNFTGYGAYSSDGGLPTSAPVFDAKGNLYGVTEQGGANGNGAVYELTPNSNGVWTEKILYSFGASNMDAVLPYQEGVVLDSAGNIYGTTYEGGVYRYGTVYELVAGSNGDWTEKILYSFQGLNDGASPLESTPVLDSAGNLFGVAREGGAHDYGVIYELSPGSGGVWTYKVIYSFPGGAGGSAPLGSLLIDSSGNLYGTAGYVAFELVRGSTGKWTSKILHRFAGGADGANPEAGMVFDKAGNLYGMTSTGGAHRGVVYELSPAATGTWTEKILHRFAANGTDGYYPGFPNLAVDASGNVFGIATQGGASNFGVFFEITP